MAQTMAAEVALHADDGGLLDIDLDKPVLARGAMVFEGRLTIAPEARERCALAVLRVTRPGWAEVPRDRLVVTDVWRDALAIVDAVVEAAAALEQQA